MNQYRNEELKVNFRILKGTVNSYHVQQLFEQFPSTSELMDSSEEQLVNIKWIGKRKRRQIRNHFRAGSNTHSPY
jgi:DNA repair protein RadC